MICDLRCEFLRIFSKKYIANLMCNSKRLRYVMRFVICNCFWVQTVYTIVSINKCPISKNCDTDAWYQIFCDALFCPKKTSCLKKDCDVWWSSKHQRTSPIMHIIHNLWFHPSLVRHWSSSMEDMKNQVHYSGMKWLHYTSQKYTM